MTTLTGIQDEIENRMEDLLDDAGTYIKAVYDYPEFTPTSFPAISLGYPTDPETGDQRTTQRNTRLIQYPIHLIVPQTKDSDGYTALLSAIDQVRTAFRVKGMRDTLNGKVNINKGITSVLIDEIKSSADFIVYTMTLSLVVYENLG